MSMKDTPVLLLAGYLGSGKTTLVNRILSNRKGIRFAVIVNDIGEVNIDADLIQKGGVVGTQDDSLVALQNGCICCTLRTDLMEQLFELVRAGKFDYIVIEASGICEPEPIARTICTMPRMDPRLKEYGYPRLDCIVSVLDALRMRDEFACGDGLTRGGIEDDDIENLIIQQLEFCNIVLINKASEVTSGELERIRRIVKAIQPSARIIECDWAEVPLDSILNTGMFDFNSVAASPGWIRGIESTPTEDEEAEARGHEEHHHHHHDHDHDHDHEEGEAEEYGIGTFVYYRRPAFDINKFDSFVTRHWPAEVIRAKGICYFTQDPDMSYMFEQAGRQKQLKEAGQWYATAPEDELEQLKASDPGFSRDWDDYYGDRMQKIVFIGRHMDVERIKHDLDFCLDPGAGISGM
ncbi:MAG TPA: GTP-binding protein [Candidatus Coprenecus stercoravium]|uniref:GTP-binding protein n=1 Tax=Candidatus Coprenecus stercoravium TaxID=2840735 RepID=A0A9D2GPZ5_9BACT|nr:GTP-binding protein [Candidatus Coprenecus stercoravium]